MEQSEVASYVPTIAWDKSAMIGHPVLFLVIPEGNVWETLSRVSIPYPSSTA